MLKDGAVQFLLVGWKCVWEDSYIKLGSRGPLLVYRLYHGVTQGLKNGELQTCKEAGVA